MRLPVCGVLLLTVLGAQSPTISVDTRLVQVDVVVHDKNGPVTNLTQDDFEVFDQGKPQKIASFAVKSNAEPLQTGLEPHPEAPRVVTNRVSGSGATVVLFDMLNTADQEDGVPSAPQSVGRLQLIKYLRTIEPAENESYALFTLLKSLRVVQDFTTDPRQILDAGLKLMPEHSADRGAEDLGAELLASAPDMKDAIANEMYKNSVKEMQDFSRKNRALITVAALRSIAAHLKGMPGRKKLVWLSASFPASTTDTRSRNGQQLLEHQEFGREINLAIRALNDANIAVYPVDPRDPYNAGLGADGIDTMNLLASGTGGKAFYNLNDLADAIRHAVHDTQVTYTLSFYPSALRPDGSFHELSVNVTRPGVEVRARKGYFAPEAKPLSEKQIEKSLEDAIGSPVNATALGIAVRVEKDQGRSGGFQIEVTFDPHELRLEHEKNNWVGTLDLITWVPQTRKPNAHRDQITITLTDARLREVLMAGRYTFRRPVEIAITKPSDMRVALADRATGATGSVQLRVLPN